MSQYCKPISIIPHDDEDRLNKLYQYEILDTPAEDDFDRIARLAAEIFDTPSAFISLVDKDRVFFKSNISTLESNEVLRKDSLCSLTILENQLTVFNDTHQIPDLLESPYVSCQGGIRFYAGAPLKTPEGYPLGTICVVDAVPRQVNEKQLKMLETLSFIVVEQLEKRLAARKAVRVQTDLMNMAAHDLKNPALNIELLTEMLIQHTAENKPVDKIIEHIRTSIGSITQKLDSMLNLSRIEGNFNLNFEGADLAELLQLVRNKFLLQAEQKGQTIKMEGIPTVQVMVDKVRIQEAFENLLSNAIKYAYPNTEIIISARMENNAVVVKFQDQGQGLSADDMKKLFTKFAKLSAVPTGKERSDGLGLSIVKALLELHHGDVWATSEGKNKGSSFFVSLPI